MLENDYVTKRCRNLEIEPPNKFLVLPYFKLILQTKN